MAWKGKPLHEAPIETFSGTVVIQKGERGPPVRIPISTATPEGWRVCRKDRHAVAVAGPGKQARRRVDSERRPVGWPAGQARDTEAARALDGQNNFIAKPKWVI